MDGSLLAPAVDWEGSVLEQMVWFQEAACKAVTPHLPALFASGCELGSQMLEYIGFWIVRGRIREEGRVSLALHLSLHHRVSTLYCKVLVNTS